MATHARRFTQRLEAGHNLVSPQYLSVLRRGERTEPSFSILAALARFFGVTVDYFSDDEQTALRSEAQLRLHQALSDADVRHLAPVRRRPERR